MNKGADTEAENRLQEAVREKWNPRWREHLIKHLHWLKSGRVTSRRVKWALKGG